MTGEFIDDTNQQCAFLYKNVHNAMDYHFIFGTLFIFIDRLSLIEEPPNSPHRRFVCEVLEKCLRYDTLFCFNDIWKLHVAPQIILKEVYVSFRSKTLDIQSGGIL